MKPAVKWILAVNLLAIAVLVFVFPHLMVAPGKLIEEHEKLETDCFACHAPLSGARTERCIVCHQPEDIGRLTTTGIAVTKPKTSTPFHQKLTRQDCLACHTDHAGVFRIQPLGRFDHALLQADIRNVCQGCHTAPKDSLHQQISGNCGQCHTQEKWVPATFDHAKFFVLDRDHDTRCETCHLKNDYQRYTCYGCHEHTPANIRQKHIEEGIRDFENCVKCHRSADEHDIRGEYGDKRNERER